MSSEPRDVLFQVLAKYGTELAGAPLRFEGILKDLSGDHPREIFALTTCLRAGIVNELRSGNGRNAPTHQAEFLQRLEREHGLSHDLAEWALNSWVTALSAPAHAATTAIANNGTGELSQRLDSSMDAVAAFVPDKSATTVEPSFPRPESTHSDYIAVEPKPLRPLPDWSAPARSLVVHPEGSPNRPSLRDALRNILSATQLVLKPGLHRFDVIINNDLCFLGEGDAAKIVLQSLTGSAILIDGGTLLAKGITISGAPNSAESAAPVVEIRSGHLTLEECDLRGREFGDIVAATGAESELVMRRCHLHRSQASGLLLREGARGYVEECQFYQNKLSNLVIGHDLRAHHFLLQD